MEKKKWMLQWMVVFAALGVRGELVDTDGDGLSGVDEVNMSGTNPLLMDTDGDGVFDVDEVHVPNVFANDMVLQRRAPIPIFGNSLSDSSVSVSIHDAFDAVVASGSGTVSNGQWEVLLPALEAGGPYRVVVAGEVGGTIEFSNVMIGEVFIVSGQSNMAMILGHMDDSSEIFAEISNSDYDMRVLVPRRISYDSPQENYLTVEGELGEVMWKDLASSKWGCSTVGYYFGMNLATELGVTVGIIHAARGGTSINQWLPEEVVESHSIKTPKPSSVWYNGMVAPAIGYGVRAILWYQGEDNASIPEDYKIALPLLMQSWRERWGIGSIPFLVFQLPGYDKNYDPLATPEIGNWGLFRVAQEWIVENNDDAYLVVNVPGGARAEIHPQDKEAVGWRASRVALKNLYGLNIVGAGPSLLSAERSGSSMVCTFDNGGAPLTAMEVTVDGLTLSGASLSGFALAGSDGVWTNATAVLSGSSTVVVSSPSVSEPVQVMYGMENFPLCNLFNTGQMPCAPFLVKDPSIAEEFGINYKTRN